MSVFMVQNDRADLKLKSNTWNIFYLSVRICTTFEHVQWHKYHVRVMKLTENYEASDLFESGEDKVEV